jgi:predicted nucleic acid-binding protein
VANENVIDTNVIISGLFWKGPPAGVLAAWVAKKFEWIVSADILAEYHRTQQTLEAKYPPPASAWSFLRGVTLSAKLTVPAELEQQACTSGDKALLQVDGYRGLRIVKPARFLKILA